jgi:hypothetical protein
MTIGFNMNTTKLSIITALHSNDLNLSKSAESIINQLSIDVRWIIKYSEDFVPKHLLEYLSHPFIDIICKKDSSLYDGLNQALDVCNSEWYMVIGSGDILVDGATSKIIKHITESNCGEALFFSTKHLINDFLFTPNPNDIHLRMSCPHPSTILKVSNSKFIDSFNINYKIASDYDHISRYLIKFNKFITSNELLILFKGGGLSENRALEGFFEEELIRTRVWNSTQIDSCKRLKKYSEWAISRLQSHSHSHSHSH